MLFDLKLLELPIITEFVTLMLPIVSYYEERKVDIYSFLLSENKVPLSFPLSIERSAVFGLERVAS